MLGGQRVAGAQARSLRRPGPRRASRRSAARSPHAATRGRAGSARAATAGQGRRAAPARRPCSTDSGTPGDAIHLQRPLDALRIRRRQPGRGDGIDPREFRVQRAASRPAPRAHRVRRGRAGRRAAARTSPSVNALKYSIVPPTSNGMRPRARIPAIATPGVAHEARGGIGIHRIDDVDEMVRHLRAFRCRRLRGADVHAAINLRGVHRHDLGGPARRECQRQRALARRRRAHQQDDGRHARRGATAASTSAQEQPVEVGHRQPVPGRPAVIALAGALGGFHLPQQRIHLGHGQRAIRAHRAVAGHRRQQLVAPRVEHAACRRTRGSRAAPRARASPDRHRRAAPARRAPPACRGRAPTSRSRAPPACPRAPPPSPLRAAPPRTSPAPAAAAPAARSSNVDFRRSYTMRSCAACMSTSTRPSRFCARM